MVETVSAMDTGWTRALSILNIRRNHAALHLWARLGSNQHVPTNALGHSHLLSPVFAGETGLARLVADPLSRTRFDSSDGHRMDKRVLRARLAPRPSLFLVANRKECFA